jgi:hypothetical protein
LFSIHFWHFDFEQTDLHFRNTTCIPATNYDIRVANFPADLLSCFLIALLGSRLQNRQHEDHPE